jgi:hypothetical protein
VGNKDAVVCLPGYHVSIIGASDYHSSAQTDIPAVSLCVFPFGQVTHGIYIEVRQKIKYTQKGKK